MDLVGVRPGTLCVTVLARPLSSTVSMTDARGVIFVNSDIEPSGSLPVRFNGDDVRGGCNVLLLRVRPSLPLALDAFGGLAVPVVLLRRSPFVVVDVVETVSNDDVVSVRLCSEFPLSLRLVSALGAVLRGLLGLVSHAVTGRNGEL